MNERLLVVAPTERDAELSRAILEQAGLTAQICTDLDQLCGALDDGVGAILLTDATLTEDASARLAAALRGQPPWSDIPVILLSSRGADSPAAVWAMNTLSNVTVLDQPVRVVTLVSALRTAVAARIRQYELRDRLESLREADRQKDEFLATLSHELRNPLAPIRNALHILRLAGADADTRARVVDTMERQIGNVIRLVDDLLELSRINEGRIELRKERVSLAAVLRGALESSAPLIEAAGHELIVEEPKEMVLLDADPLRLTQVIANLLNNAARYTNPGGTVRLTARREGAEAVISVRDSGIGIPPEMLGRIFDMFVQVEPSPERARQGLGIGLTLVKRLTELHGGRVEARSAGPGEGSEFIVRLPAQADRRSATPATAPARSPDAERRKSRTPSRRILLVDDHHDSADSLATLLRLLGHDVRVAYDGPAAISTATAWVPDVVLLDLGLPGMDGYATAAALRAIPGVDDALLLALTGFGREQDRRHTHEAGFDGHLVKPVDLTVLNRLLAEPHGEGRVAATPLPELSRRGTTRRRDADPAREP
jgi:signal transduction histidine kinase/ActR/RegA family two-component response regulator